VETKITSDSEEFSALSWEDKALILEEEVVLLRTRVPMDVEITPFQARKKEQKAADPEPGAPSVRDKAGTFLSSKLDILLAS
jgi:hypothetical protein